MITGFELLLGHMVGDYLLQNKWMAFNKSNYSAVGWLSCVAHCLLYTLSVCVATSHWSVEWVILVFLSHFILDKFEVVELYLKLIKGRSIKVYLNYYTDSKYSPEICIQAGFTSLVYAAADNTAHLLLMWVCYKYII